MHEQPATSLEDAREQSRTRFCWVVNYLSDYRDFDFLWEPTPWESHQCHAWPSEWHPNRCTSLLPKSGWSETNYHTEIIPTSQVTFKYLLDHGNNELQTVTEFVSPNKVVRYFDNYLDTLRRIANSCQEEYIWICSSICDYSNFDFDWRPNSWQLEMLHVFSDNQKFGDTFLMHVPSFRERSGSCVMLDWYDLHFVSDVNIPRLPMPIIQHTNDTHVDAVKTAQWSGPLALFTKHDYVPGNLVSVPLWEEKTKTIVPLDSGASSVIVPRVAVPYIKTQLYDYPHIDKTHQILKDEPLDIIFLSNGENEAEYLYNRLEGCITDLQPNRLVRVENIKGRVASQHAAAMASSTDWYFVVPGKLEVDSNFPWDWQPDRMQQPKHYIFHASNPINGLTYGHMAMVAYNKKLVLETQGTGLDFTLEKEHEVVPVISGTANYYTSPIICWRTAFREVIKLKYSLPDVENEYRLNMWLSNAGEVKNAEWSQFGAEDAVEYYNEVNGDFTALKKSYEWDWLASYAFIKRGLV